MGCSLASYQGMHVSSSCPRNPLGVDDQDLHSELQMKEGLRISDLAPNDENAYHHCGDVPHRDTRSSCPAVRIAPKPPAAVILDRA